MSQIKTVGISTLKHEPWRLQLYWPSLTIRKGPQSEIMLGLDTVARIAIDRRSGFYVGVGFQVLGFGFAVDYFVPNPESKP